jgi:uncharacterized repeat protein (TIGR03803 family)
MSALHAKSPILVRTWTCALILLCTVTVTSQAQTFTKLVDLSPATGEYPQSPLTQGVDGNLYGTTAGSGAFAQGTFFQITPSGTVTTLYNFCLNNATNCPDGAVPSGAVALGPDGNFYGTTAGNPSSHFGNGTVYKITPAGSLATLHSFCSLPQCRDGGPFTQSGLTLAQNGTFYGSSGRTNSDWGRVFRISSSGTFVVVHVDCPGRVCPTDAGPWGTLDQARGGYLIGTGMGGTYGTGGVYRMTPSGTPTLIYSFCPACGDPDAGWVSALTSTQAGNFVGTSTYGGSGANCTATVTSGCGIALMVLPFGFDLYVLHDFCSWKNCADGENPASLIQATDGNFYGVASFGGMRGGTIFKITPGAEFSLIHTFTGDDGFAPSTALVQATDGNLYGTTFQGGLNSGGTIFRVSLGLAPFVKTVQPAGKVADPIIILGNNLTGSTSVKFNGTAATFTVLSDTEITATVPTSATVGKIQVVTPSATLLSNAAFTVLK